MASNKRQEAEIPSDARRYPTIRLNDDGIHDTSKTPYDHRRAVSSLTDFRHLHLPTESDSRFQADMPAGLLAEDDTDDNLSDNITSGARRIICAICHEGFASRSALGRHEVVWHKHGASLKCPAPGCVYRSMRLFALADHFLSVHFKVKYPCPLGGCFKKYTNEQTLRQHVVKYHEGIVRQNVVEAALNCDRACMPCHLFANVYSEVDRAVSRSSLVWDVDDCRLGKTLSQQVQNSNASLQTGSDVAFSLKDLPRRLFIGGGSEPGRLVCPFLDCCFYAPLISLWTHLSDHHAVSPDQFLKLLLSPMYLDDGGSFSCRYSDCRARYSTSNGCGIHVRAHRSLGHRLVEESERPSLTSLSVGKLESKSSEDAAVFSTSRNYESFVQASSGGGIVAVTSSRNGGFLNYSDMHELADAFFELTSLCLEDGSPRKTVTQHSVGYVVKFLRRGKGSFDVTTGGVMASLFFDRSLNVFTLTAAESENGSVLMGSRLLYGGESVSLSNPCRFRIDKCAFRFRLLDNARNDRRQEEIEYDSDSSSLTSPSSVRSYSEQPFRLVCNIMDCRQFLHDISDLCQHLAVAHGHRVQESRLIPVSKLETLKLSVSEDRSACGDGGCQAVFLDTYDSLSHHAFIHGEPPFVGHRKPIKCPACPMLFLSVSFKEDHKWHVHKAQFPYRCPYCQHFASTSQYLRRHINNRHEETGEEVLDQDDDAW